jgi:hypothetical protein
MGDQTVRGRVAAIDAVLSTQGSSRRRRFSTRRIAPDTSRSPPSALVTLRRQNPTGRPYPGTGRSTNIVAYRLRQAPRSARNCEPSGSESADAALTYKRGSAWSWWNCGARIAKAGSGQPFDGASVSLLPSQEWRLKIRRGTAAACRLPIDRDDVHRPASARYLDTAMYHPARSRMSHSGQEARWLPRQCPGRSGQPGSSDPTPQHGSNWGGTGVRGSAAIA